MYLSTTPAEVERTATKIERRWRVLSTLIGPRPAQIACLLRRLSGDLQETLAVAADAKEAARRWEGEAHGLKCDMRTVTLYLDKAIDKFRKTNVTGVILMSEGDFRQFAEYEYDCTAKGPMASSGQRWSYTYRGFPIWTARGIAGPVVVTKPIFEGMRLAIGSAAALRER